MNGEIIECNLYEQEFLKPDFDFDSSINHLESLNIDLCQLQIR